MCRKGKEKKDVYVYRTCHLYTILEEKKERKERKKRTCQSYYNTL